MALLGLHLHQLNALHTSRCLSPRQSISKGEENKISFQEIKRGFQQLQQNHHLIKTTKNYNVLIYTAKM